MGNGVPRLVANTILTSLNETFGRVNMPQAQLRYGMLNTLYPNFLVYTADTTDRHVWRKRTLRHAGWLLTSEVDFNPPHVSHPYPAKNFKKWLRWLTWLQVMPPANATVTVNNALVAIAPAEAIMTTLKAALEDPAQAPVAFHWNEGAILTVAAICSPGNYSITITSVKEADISNVHDNDEDDLP